MENIELIELLFCNVKANYNGHLSKIEGTDRTVIERSTISDEDLNTIKNLGFKVEQELGNIKISGYKDLVTNENKEKYSELLKVCEPSKTQKNISKFLVMAATTYATATGLSLSNNWVGPGTILGTTGTFAVALAIPVVPLMLMGAASAVKVDYLHQCEMITIGRLQAKDFSVRIEPSDDLFPNLAPSIKAIRDKFFNSTPINVTKPQ